VAVDQPIGTLVAVILLLYIYIYYYCDIIYIVILYIYYYCDNIYIYIIVIYIYILYLAIDPIILDQTGHGAHFTRYSTRWVTTSVNDEMKDAT
jgi:hypothetical protein